MLPRAWVRPIPDRYVDATRGVLSANTEPIDVERARAQHGEYCAGLEWLGFQLTRLPPANALPDSVFVEDPAVLSGHRALIARSAHPVRAQETPSVRDALAPHFRLVEMGAGATLDGGDVLRVGKRFWVSPSERTNGAGIEALQAAFEDHTVTVVPLPPSVLHLKCACSRADERTVVFAKGALDRAVFDGLTTIEVPADELYAANTVGLGGRILVAAGFPATLAAVQSAGLEVRALQVSEIRKGDGSLTCMSLRSEPPLSSG